MILTLLNTTSLVSRRHPLVSCRVGSAFVIEPRDSDQTGHPSYRQDRHDDCDRARRSMVLERECEQDRADERAKVDREPEPAERSISEARLDQIGEQGGLRRGVV